MHCKSLKDHADDAPSLPRVRLLTTELEHTTNRSIAGSVPLSHAGSLIAEHIGRRDRECVVVLHLDTRERITDIELAAVGILDEVLIHPREIFKAAIVNNAASIVIGHNHPSGDLSPSHADYVISRQVAAVGAQLGIPVREFYIVHGANAHALELT